MRQWLAWVAIFLCVNVGSVALADPVTVVTTGGVLKGDRQPARPSIHLFRGVPFARPPVSELRWRPPEAIRWKGIRSATRFALPCAQPTAADGSPNGGGVSGPSSEDCLYLNIWAPAEADSAPVMLWIHGGGGVVGAGSVPAYDGTAFARDGIVLVTINYRLGALGGFTHPALDTEAEASGRPFGNYHLLDAIAALRWTRQNAAAFGGDPANLTVFGESAGATMTANLLTSPMAKGLFDKAIVQSTGSLPTPATELVEARQRGVEAMTILGLPPDATADQLRAVPAERFTGNRKAGWGVRTILDGRIKQQSILDGFASGRAIDVPMIIGTNSDEGRLRGTQLVATHAERGAPVWQYFFDYVPQVRRREHPNGAPHAGEIPFVFDTLALDRHVGSAVTETDQLVASRVHSCWVAFAKLPAGADAIRCEGGFRWPSRNEANNHAVAIFQELPSLGRADDLRSPPNGAAPGPTSRP